MASRNKIVAGNFKLNKTIAETQSYLAEWSGLANGAHERANTEVLIFPTPMSLAALKPVAGLSLGVQNIGPAVAGAMTGELSVLIAKEMGCQWVLLGHSERRHVFGESNQLIRQKLELCLNQGLKPMLCIGETLAQNEEKKTRQVLLEQLSVLKGLSALPAAVAYEPVWAIGTGKTATPEFAQEIIGQIRLDLVDVTQNPKAKEIPILYGGSVTTENAKTLMALPDVDGCLVGGASLRAADFLKIVESAPQ